MAIHMFCTEYKHDNKPAKHNNNSLVIKKSNASYLILIIPSAKTQPVRLITNCLFLSRASDTSITALLKLLLAHFHESTSVC